MDKIISIVGCGAMGQAVAQNLCDAGYAVHVYAYKGRRHQALINGGVRYFDSLAKMPCSDALLSLLPNDASLLDLSKQVINTPVLINMATVSPRTSEQVRGRLAMNYIDAPVLGSSLMAQSKRLLVLASGDKAAIDACSDVFAATAKAVHYCGEGSAACVYKLAVNLLLAHMTNGLAMVASYAQQLSLDAAALFELLQSSALSSPLLQVKTPLLVEQNYPVQFALKHMLKDLHLIQDSCGGQNGALNKEISGLLQNYQQALTAGFGDQDMSAVQQILTRSRS